MDQFERASARAQRRQASEPIAISARYDRHRGQVVVDLTIATATGHRRAPARPSITVNRPSTIQQCLWVPVRDGDVNRDHPRAHRPSTIANVSGTGGVKSRPAHLRFFPKTESDFAALTRRGAFPLGRTMERGSL
jgi:hypothetical protein